MSALGLYPPLEGKRHGGHGGHGLVCPICLHISSTVAGVHRVHSGSSTVQWLEKTITSFWTFFLLYPTSDLKKCLQNSGTSHCILIGRQFSRGLLHFCSSYKGRHNSFCSGLFFQGGLLSKPLWKIVSSSETEGKFVCIHYNKNSVALQKRAKARQVCL